ncbi:ABC transporter substrate-binding protein [Candidatus Parcubacteria bacterium]|nr:ABC transporter substrate-binding protein [Candidatus Parcubacteria bacterium]
MPNSWLTFLTGFFKKILSKIYYIKNIWQIMSSMFLKLIFKKKNSLDKQKEFDQQIVHSVSRKRWPSFRQLKYLPQVLSIDEKRKIKKLCLVVSVIFIVLTINFYFAGTQIVPRVGGDYTEGLVGMPKFINPLYSSLNSVDQDLVKLIYAGLIKTDKDQNLVPDLAESWKISLDQKVYSFTLKKDLLWHDGEPLTVDDIIFTFEAIQNPEFKSPLANNFEDIKIERIDDTNLRFILEEPYAPFLENLTVGILPMHLWQEVIPANALLADYNLKPIGSGVYKFRSLSKDKLGNIKNYILARNKNCVDHPAYLEEIIFKFYPDFNSAVDAFNSHNVDGINYLPKELKSELSLRKDINFYDLQLPQLTALFFNQANNPVLKNLNVRQALAHALDKNEIINSALTMDGQIINAPILPGSIGYNPNIFKYEFDLTKTEELLNNAGYVKNQDDDFRKKDETELKVVLTTVNNKENSAVANLIQKMWQLAGIKTEINLVEPGLIKSEVIKKRAFEILLFGEVVGNDPDPYPFWHSSQAGEAGFNLSNFINREADKVLEEARKISDPQQRHDKYVHFQNILNQSLPAIFLYTPSYTYPVSNKIKGIETSNIITPADRFSNIRNWFIKTKRSL